MPKVTPIEIAPIEATRTLPARSLDFWFDYTCPFAYLGSTQAARLAEKMGVPLRYQPMLLGGVLRAVGVPQNLAATLGPAKAAHNAADMFRWAKRFGVPLTMPASHPMRSVEALRATLAAGIDPRVVDGFYRAYWVEGRDIASRDVIADVLTRAGQDAEAVLTRAATQEVKDDLRKRTDEAIALGVFGAPTWIVDGTHLYWGQDRMRFVCGAREADTAGEDAPIPTTARSGSRRRLEVFWDFSSPFAYLGTSQVEALLRRTGADVVWRPMLLGGLFRSVGTADVPLMTFSDAKKRHVGQDLDRWAAYWRVPFRFPSRFPMNTVKALRTWIALPADLRDRFREATFRAYWVEDKDISDDAVLAACIGDVAAADDALARASSDAVKAELRASTEEAAKRGVFGAPTFIVDGELFWGQDRLELVEAALSAP